MSCSAVKYNTTFYLFSSLISIIMPSYTINCCRWEVIITGSISSYCTTILSFEMVSEIVVVWYLCDFCVVFQCYHFRQLTSNRFWTSDGTGSRFTRYKNWMFAARLASQPWPSVFNSSHRWQFLDLVCHLCVTRERVYSELEYMYFPLKFIADTNIVMAN
jgi:hypothetical protein